MPLLAGLAWLAMGITATAADISLESAPPVVVKTVPVAGATDVDPALAEIRVTYSKAMQDGSWSWSTWGQENYPETAGKPRYLADARTCVLPVKLQPNKFYAIWLNSDKFQNFKDTGGRAAVPYLLTFRTPETGAGSVTREAVDFPIKTIVLTRATNQLVESANNVRTVSVWTDSTMQPGETLQARVRAPDGEMRNASSSLFVRWRKTGVSSSTSFSWFFKGAFGEPEAKAAVAQIQAGKAERPIRLASREPLELFAVTNQQGGVMSGYVEFVHTEPSPPIVTDGTKARIKALVRIVRFAGYFPSLDYSADVPPGYALRATATDGEVNTHSPAGPYQYSSTWFRIQPLPGSPAAMQRWPEQRQAQQTAFQAQLQKLQDQGPFEVVLGEPRLLFTITNSPSDVLQGFLELVGPATVAATVRQTSVAPDAFLPMLNDDQRAVLAWTDRQFRSFFDARTFDGWSDEERAALERKSIDALSGPRSTEYYQALNTLAALRSTKALPRLREIASERVDRNNRDRWMAIRSLGLIGDQADVPALIHLVYHGNVNTRWWAQISLVRITGKNFGGDWNAWGKWWNEQKGEPPYQPEIVRWWDGQPEPDKLAQSLNEGDQKFLGDLKGKPAATPTISSSELAARIRAAEPTMNGIRENWTATVTALDGGDNTTALAAARKLTPHIHDFLDKFRGTALEAGTSQALELIKSLATALEKNDQAAVQTARSAMNTLGQSMEEQIKASVETAASDPFTGCRIASFGGEKSDGKQSYGGRGPALRFQPSELAAGVRADQPVKLKGVRLYASRYGGGYTPETTTLRVTLRDARDVTLGEARFAYAKFGFEPQWVDLVFEQPVTITRPGEPITLAFDPEAAQTKGIYFHYQNNPTTSHSLAGTVSSGFTELTDREWLMRVAFE